MSAQQFYQLAEQMDVNGYAVIDGLFKPEECDEMRNAANDLVIDPSQTAGNIPVFTTEKEQQINDPYFLESNDKIRRFFEEGAIGPDGRLKVAPRVGINKIGHALHALVPLFRFYTYCDRVKAAAKMLNFKEPAVIQSMVIFKNPHIGCSVRPHQDSTFLFAEPRPVIGFWIALDDATIQNGCLQVISGSHKSGVHRRLVRNTNPNSRDVMIYTGASPIYPASSFRPLTVRKGACVMLHGNVVHKSATNFSSKARPAYTFHVVERKDNIFSPANWLKEGPGAPFENLYDVTPTV